jgi:hypothetical protein
MNEKHVIKIGWLASFMGMAMFFSYIDQIRLNIAGHPGSLVLPVVTTVNCTAWIIYGSVKIKRDWPIIVCNIPGILLGIIAAVTAVIYK